MCHSGAGKVQHPTLPVMCLCTIPVPVWHRTYHILYQYSVEHKSLVSPTIVKGNREYEFENKMPANWHFMTNHTTRQ